MDRLRARLILTLVVACVLFSGGAYLNTIIVRIPDWFFLRLAAALILATPLVRKKLGLF